VLPVTPSDNCGGKINKSINTSKELIAISSLFLHVIEFQRDNFIAIGLLTNNYAKMLKTFLLMFAALRCVSYFRRVY
jgi:hypothetical protein